MGTITLSVPDALKAEMDKTDWVNWSSVARRAFAETLSDVKEVELKRKIMEISEISDDDKRVVKGSVVREAVKRGERAVRLLKAGKLKPMTPAELDKLMGLK